MYKIANKDGINVAYNKENMQILLNKTKKPVEITFFINNSKTIDDIHKIDGFNFMDFQIVSKNARSAIENFHPTSDVDYKRAKLFYQKEKLHREYFVMLLHKRRRVSAIDSNYVDPSNNSYIPVIKENPDCDVFFDSELFFPVLTESVIQDLKKKNFNIKFFKYPHCGKIEVFDKDIRFLTPLPGIPGEVVLCQTLTCTFYQCLESGFIWLSDNALFEDIEKITEEYPHRKFFYEKKNRRWKPKNKFSFKYFDLISSEKTRNVSPTIKL